jgi:excisionase family DNA binding protein
MAGTGLLTIEQVADLLQVPKGYVYRLNYEGKIPGLVRIGHRTIRYKAEAIEQWVTEGCPPFIVSKKEWVKYEDK